MRTLLLLAAVSLMGVPAFAAEGTVAYRISGCDYFVVFTPNGYDVLEWYGGWNPHKGDELVGPFEEYGMHDIFDYTTQRGIRVWVEEFWLTKQDALRILKEECD